MYLSVGRDDIYNVITILFDFLEQNDIVHEYKIGIDVRSYVSNLLLDRKVEIVDSMKK